MLMNRRRAQLAPCICQRSPGAEDHAENGDDGRPRREGDGKKNQPG